MLPVYQELSSVRPAEVSAPLVLPPISLSLSHLFLFLDLFGRDGSASGVPPIIHPELSTDGAHRRDGPRHSWAIARRCFSEPHT